MSSFNPFQSNKITDAGEAPMNVGEKKNVDDLAPRSAFDHDGDMEGMTVYEKKCVLINREIDNNGMGRYQWYIWSLCGFGYLLDLLWAQAFGLVLSPLEQELGFAGNQSGYISVGTLADYRHVPPIMLEVV